MTSLSISARISLICCVFLLLDHQVALAKGRGGSSRSGSSRYSYSGSSRYSYSGSSRYSYSSRSSRYSVRYSSYSSSGRSRYRTTRYASGRYRDGGSYSRMSTLVREGLRWSVKYRAFRYGYYLNTLTWRQSHSELSADTSICFNIQDALPSEYNSSVQVPWIYQNRTTYGIFLCPLDGRSDKTYCCGDDGAEWCCTFWDDSGRLIAVAVGGVAGLVVIAIVACALAKCVAGSTSGSNSVAAAKVDELPPPYPGHFSNESFHGNNDYVDENRKMEMEMEMRKAASADALEARLD